MTETPPQDRRLGYAAASAHPEEIRARVRFRVGKSVSLNATARTTPAGLVAAGVMVAAIILSVAAVVRASRRTSSAQTPTKN
jgi:hypothetical protein